MNDVGERRQPRQFQRIAFIPPQRAGVGRANAEKKLDQRGEENRNAPLGVFKDLGIHVRALAVRLKMTAADCAVEKAVARV